MERELRYTPIERPDGAPLGIWWQALDPAHVRARAGCDYHPAVGRTPPYIEIGEGEIRAILHGDDSIEWQFRDPSTSLFGRANEVLAVLALAYDAGIAPAHLLDIPKTELTATVFDKLRADLRRGDGKAVMRWVAAMRKRQTDWTRTWCELHGEECPGYEFERLPWE